MNTKKENSLEIKGPLHEIIKLDDRLVEFELYRFDFKNEIADLVSNERVSERLFQSLDQRGVLNDTYYVLEKGNVRNSSNSLIRVHSACFHGDTLRHVICDCGEQYEAALKQIAEEEGLLIYCEGQDGRGIHKKLHFRSYLDQQENLWDTFESFRRRGLNEDPRDYSNVVKILKYYGLSRIRLLTNNPEKIQSIKSSDIEVERIPIWVKKTGINSKQIEAKLRRGHLQ